MYSNNSWKPTSSIKNIIKKSFFIKKIRNFFYKKNYIEVNTPTLSRYTVTDAHLNSFKTVFKNFNKNIKFYLITSPEYHMKRLISCNIGPIFQICSSFRNGEIGKIHQPEFTMLEWYNPNLNMNQLIKETKEFLKKIILCKKIEKLSYKDIYKKYLKIDPLKESIYSLQKKAISYKLEKKIIFKLNKNELIKLLFCLYIEPKLGKNYPIIIYHFPKEQSYLSEINKNNIKVSNRFEVYFKGIELANGFQELTDVYEHYKRFKKQNLIRKKLNISTKKIDKYFMSSLNYGLPSCSGIALGIDRLFMIYIGKKNIRKAISFSLENS